MFNGINCHIGYFANTNIWLSLEWFYNRGLSSERAKEIIDKMYDPYGSGNFQCIPSGLNGNWIIQTRTSSKEGIEDIIDDIETKLLIECLYHADGIKA